MQMAQIDTQDELSESLSMTSPLFDPARNNKLDTNPNDPLTTVSNYTKQDMPKEISPLFAKKQNEGAASEFTMLNIQKVESKEVPKFVFNSMQLQSTLLNKQTNLMKDVLKKKLKEQVKFKLEELK